MSAKQLRAEAKAWRRIGQSVAKQPIAEIYAIPAFMLTRPMVLRIEGHLIGGRLFTAMLTDPELQTYYVMRSELLALECEDEANALRPETRGSAT